MSSPSITERNIDFARDKNPALSFMVHATELVQRRIGQRINEQGMLNEVTRSVQDTSVTKGLPWLFYRAVRTAIIEKNRNLVNEAEEPVDEGFAEE
ncbi:Uu.00g058290.m01.CDS01 [Anthostomella pinea]|uniref:Uu.00g058290.m01.CDS01 n=1 Tax=Anthostomella pinea TaxID=933095 RepID=A0AAI8VSM9_9PEZI|nr:Uu.00g058290.m01.CDS01 [Anthostomella pinea]